MNVALYPTIIYSNVLNKKVIKKSHFKILFNQIHLDFLKHFNAKIKQHKKTTKILFFTYIITTKYIFFNGIFFFSLFSPSS